MLKNFFYFLLVSLLLNSFTMAQDEATKDKSATPDSTEDKWNWDNWDDEDENYDEDEFQWDESYDHDWNFNWGHESTPTFSVLYGFSELGLKTLRGNFAKPNLIEVKIGYSDIDEKTEGGYLVDYDYTFLYINNTSTKLSNKDDQTRDIRSDMWRFGLGWTDGVGYKFGKSSIIPYVGSTMNWSRLNRKDTPRDSLSQWKLDRFEDSFRFGESFEAGLRLSVIPQVSIDVNYERGVIYSRHMFWKWAGAKVIEITALSLLDGFISEIEDNAPVVAPIINILLKGALNYGLYELKSEKMNWPFATAEPLTHDQFKIGMTFSF